MAYLVWWDADPRVQYLNANQPLLMHAAQAYPTFRRVFGGIRNEIAEGLPERAQVRAADAW